MNTNRTLGRRPLLGAAAAAFAVTLLAVGPAFSQQADMLELKLAVTDPNINPVTDSVLKLAAQFGYYEKHGVKVTIVPLEGTPQAVAALNSGAVDLADISIDALIRLKAENGVNLKGFVSSTLGPPYLIAAKEDIKTAADLVGRSYAIADNGSLDHTLTQAVLGSMNIDRDGPKYVAIGAPAVRVQALAAGQVDATTVSYGTYLPISNTPGLHIIVSPEDFFKAAPVQSKLVVGLNDTLSGKQDAIQRFTDALVDISRTYDKQPATWVEDMQKVRDDLTKEQLEDTSKFLAGRWCVNGCANINAVQSTVDFIYKGPDFTDIPKVAATDIADESFVLNSIKTLGTYPDGGIDARQ